MKNCNLVAIDIAKNVFQLHGIDKESRCCLTKRLSRDSFKTYLHQLPVCTIVMEACGSAHYWGRYLQKLGHEVKLISPQYVKPFVKGNKTDKNDSQAIAEAALRPSMRFVGIKNVEQQDIQCVHKIRERVIHQRTALSNQIRGLLLEYGIAIPQGIHVLMRYLPEILEDSCNELSDFMRGEMSSLYSELIAINQRIDSYDQKLQTMYKQSEVAQRMGKVEGVGRVIATALLGLGDVKHFKNGRHFSAFLGLVPKEHSSGNKQRQMGITKRGNCYIRQLLIHGARSVLIRVKNKQDKKSQWLQELIARRGMNRACCALANKMARVLWVIMAKGENYKVSVEAKVV